MYRLLDGMRIVEGSAFVAAPLGGMTLAQLGADVIRFDDIGGPLDGERWPVTAEGASLYWAGLNKGKRHVAIDVRAPEGRELIARLITAPGEGGGLFLTNLPVRGWCSHEALSARRADLVMLALTGTRIGEPHVDYTINATMGFPMVTGPDTGGAPVNNVLPAWDLSAGLTLATGLLAAERHRRLTGEGQFVRLALMDVALAATAALGYIGEAEVNGTDRPRVGNQIFGTYGNAFRTGDGRWVMLCMFTARHVQAARSLLGEAFTGLEAELGANLEDEAARWEARARIDALLTPWFAARSLAEAATALDAAGALWGPYRSFRQMVAEAPELVTDHPMFARIEQPGIGAYHVPGSPLDFTGLTREPPRPAARFGQHTEEVLAEVLGLSGGEIAALHDRRIVASPV